jgi:hypothetical protein
MRALSSAAGLLLIGCAATHGPLPDDAAVADAMTSLEDAPTHSMTDAGPPLTPEDARDCAGWAAFACGRYAECAFELVWLYGSRERCASALRAVCEHDEALEGTGDLASARVACATDWAGGCHWATEPFASCVPPSGSRAVGEPCRSDLQCGEGVAADGRTLRLRCFRDTTHEPACDSGSCQLPLPEGAGHCGEDTIDRDRCDEGLACAGHPTRLCMPVPPGRADGEACTGLGAVSDCETGLVCGTAGVCEPARTNGASCDPDLYGHCAGPYVYECDPTTRTCTAIPRALDGEACADGGPSCSRASECVMGRCEPGTELPSLGTPCGPGGACGGRWACVDGACAPEPCD